LELLKTLTSAVTDLQKTLAHLDHELGHHDGDVLAHSKHMRDRVLTAMLDVRKSADRLEGLVADDLWPLPTYREMLFIK
jgi:glutamine synthetase